jgi:hypothetical protein
MESADHFYQIVLEKMRWSEAQAHAEELGGHLAVIDSVDKQQEIQPFLDIKPVGWRYLWSFHLFMGATGDAQKDQ